MRRISSRRSISLHPSQKRRCTIIVQNSEVRMSRYLDTSTTTPKAKIMVRYGRPSPLERNLYGHPVVGLLWERQFEKILLNYDWEKVSNWECLFVHRGKRLFLSVYVDDTKLAGKKQNLDPMWKLLNKEVDLGEPTSFLDHVYLRCTQRQCEISKDIVDNYRIMFKSNFSGAEQKKKASVLWESS